MPNYGPYSQQTNLSTGPLANKMPPDSQHKANGPQPAPSAALGPGGINTPSFVNGDPNNRTNQQTQSLASSAGNNLDSRAQNPAMAQHGHSRQNSGYAPSPVFPMPPQGQAMQNSSVPPPVLPVGFRLESNTGNGQYPVPPTAGPAVAANAAPPAMQPPHLGQVTNPGPGHISQNNLPTQNMPPAGVPAGVPPGMPTGANSFTQASLPPNIRRVSGQSFSPVGRAPDGMIMQPGSLPPSSAPPAMPTQHHPLPTGPIVGAAGEKQALTAPPAGLPLGITMHSGPPDSDPRIPVRQNMPPGFSSPYPPNMFPMPIDRGNPTPIPIPQGLPISGVSPMPMQNPNVPVPVPNGMHSIPQSQMVPPGTLNGNHPNSMGQVLYSNQHQSSGPSPPVMNSPGAQNRTQPPPGFSMPAFTPGSEARASSSGDLKAVGPVQRANDPEDRDQTQPRIPKSLMVLNDGKPMNATPSIPNGAPGSSKGLGDGPGPAIANGQNAQVAHIVPPGAGPPMVFNNPTSAPQLVVEPPTAVPGAPPGALAPPGAVPAPYLPNTQPHLPVNNGPPPYFPPMAPENSTGPTVDTDQLKALADLNGVPRLPAEYPNATPLQKELEKLTAQTWADLAKLAKNVGHYNASLECLKNAVKFRLSTPEVYLLLGDCYQNLNACESAVICYQMVIKEQPNNGDAWAEISYCYLNLNDLEKAYQSYQQALFHLDGNDPKLWYGIGTLYDRYGSLEYAKTAFLQVLKVSENKKRFDKIPEVYFRLGLIFKQLRKFDLALKSFYYILNDPPKPLKASDIWFQIGNVFVEQENIKGACDAYLEVLKENTGHYKVLQQLGWLYYQQNELDEALKYLTRSLELDPAESQSWYLLGRCHMSAKRYQKAYEAYQQAVYRDSRNPTFWCSIGVLYYQISQYRDALDAYSRAISLNPYISEAWYDLGMLYESCNNHTSDALYAYQRAARLDPSNTHITKRISQLETIMPSKPLNNPAAPNAQWGQPETQPAQPASLDKSEVYHPPLGNQNPPSSGSIESFSGTLRQPASSNSTSVSPGGSATAEISPTADARNNSAPGEKPAVGPVTPFPSSHQPGNVNRLPAVTQPIVPPSFAPPTQPNSSHNGPSTVTGSQEQARTPSSGAVLPSIGARAAEPVLPPPVLAQPKTPAAGQSPPKQTEEIQPAGITTESNTAVSPKQKVPKDTSSSNTLNTQATTNDNPGAKLPNPGNVYANKEKQVKLPPNFQMLQPVSTVPDEQVIASPRNSQVIDTKSGTDLPNSNGAKDSETHTLKDSSAQPVQPVQPVQPAEPPKQPEPIPPAPVEASNASNATNASNVQSVRSSPPVKLENTHVPQNERPELATSQMDNQTKDKPARSSPRTEVEKPHRPSHDFSRSEDGVRRSQEFQPLQQSEGRWEPLQAQGGTNQSKKQEGIPTDTNQSAKRTASGSGSPTKRRMIAEDEDYD